MQLPTLLLVCREFMLIAPARCSDVNKVGGVWMMRESALCPIFMSDLIKRGPLDIWLNTEMTNSNVESAGLEISSITDISTMDYPK